VDPTPLSANSPTPERMVRAAYNYAEHLPVRRQMMQAWADYLDKLRKVKPEEARSIRMSIPSSNSAQAAWMLLSGSNEEAA
jgi:hypothetical protein